MSNANALFLLADHVKLSLLERKRAHSLESGGGGDSDSQDGHISRSLDQFRDGIEGLRAEKERLDEAGDESRAATIADVLPDLEKQLETLTSQFHGFSAPTASATPDVITQSTSRPTKPSLRSPSSYSPATNPSNPNKSVRFTDANRAPSPDPADTAALFSRPYRDDPGSQPPTYRDQASALDSNDQIHAYHQGVMAQQDAQLDALGASIGRQRELSMQIGDELDGQAELLEEGERRVDRHQSTLDRARRQVNRVTAGAAAGEGKQIMIIVVLILILVLLIAVLK